MAYTFDPQQEYYTITWELYRCCLLRTLMSYPGLPGVAGTALQPDLAAAPPQVSSDGLTWTFQIKPDIHYSPPLQNVVVSAQDFVRAVDREACPDCSAGGYSFYYDAVQGFRAAYKANSRVPYGERDKVPLRPVVGVRALNPLTFQVRLNHPAGDLPYLFAMAATAPIPPLPGHPHALLGIATGHDENDGRFSLVGTGPYMIKGTDKLDFSVPPKKQQPVSGYVPGKSIVFVQNPSWQQSTDPPRHQYVKEMDFTIGGTEEDAAREVDSGVVDLCMDCPPIPGQVHAYLSNPQLRDRLQVHPADELFYISMNVAQPPFDDIHVRRAVEYAIDKQGMRQLRGGPLVGEIATHIFPDSLEGNALQHYDPYATPGGRGSLALAKAQMKLSRYDHNHNGICDVKACKNVFTFIDQNDPYPAQAALIARDIGAIGITLLVRSCVRGPCFYPRCLDPTAHAALCPGDSYGADYPDASTMSIPLFASSSIGPAGCCNDGLVGASPGLLRQDRYKTSGVPSVDAQLHRCERLTGDPRIRCWTNLDRYLMEKVASVVPYLFDNAVNVLSARVACYSFDQFTGQVALDHLCVVPPYSPLPGPS